MITMDPVSNALLGAVFGELFRVMTHVINVMSRSSCKELESKLNCLRATIDEVLRPTIDSFPPSHQAWADFRGRLEDGVQLARKCQRVSRFNFFTKYRYGRKIEKLEKDIVDFLQSQGLADIALGVQNANRLLQNHSQQLEHLQDIIIRIGKSMALDANENSLMLRQIMKAIDQKVYQDDAHEPCDCNEMQPTHQAVNTSFHVPGTPNPVVGFDIYLSELKTLVLRSEVNVIGVTGMGGSGKTTLALALCNDPHLKDFFKNHVVFVTVSQKPNVLGILETMWDKIVGGKRPGFQNVEDARYQLQMQLRARASQPTLVVLDDVWSRSDLENLLFNEGKQHKTLVTTRNNQTIPCGQSERVYSLQSLKESDALSLFCLWAFGHPTIPKAEDETLVKQVQAECKALPLALKVIGSSLHGQPKAVWESAKNKLSRAESISDYHKKRVLDRLETSIDMLEEEELKQCFLDLGAFPEDRKVAVDALLHMWVYVRGIEWHDAFCILLELASRNLLNLTSYPGSRAMSYDCGCELFFSQHDVMRDLALHLANRDNAIRCKRLFMPRKENGIPHKWKALKDHGLATQIVSIHTGQMDKEQWCQIDFPYAEALILFFAAAEYHLPPFLRTMPRLKVLMIYNYSSKRATLNGLDGLLSLTQIKTIQLERLKIPPLLEYCESLELEKLSVSLCEGLGNMTRLDRHLSPNFPKLMEIIVDHCSDLEELPTRICDWTSLQTLCISNCHLLHKLPDELGKLSELRLLRLSACPSLATLPASICQLGRLEILDISQCGFLKEFPLGLEGLSMLKKLDVRECFGLRKVPEAIGRLTSLRHVICDERNKQQWLSINCSPQITVEAVDEFFSTDLYTTNDTLYICTKEDIQS